MGRGAGRADAGARHDAAISLILDSLRRTIRGFRSAAQRAERTLHLSGAQHFVVEQLARAPVASLNELAARTLTHKSSLSVVVARLVEQGYVRRRQSAVDRRQAGFALSAAGRRLLRRAPPSAQTRMIAALRHLDPGDVEQFARLFERVTAALGFAALPPTMIFEQDAARPRAAARGRRSHRKE